MRNATLLVKLAIIFMLLGCEQAAAACAFPYQLTNGQTADAMQVMANFAALANCLQAAGPGGTTNAVQFNSGNGSFGGVGPLGNGQIVIGSSGNAPQAAGISAGGGIVVTNGPGSITISTTGAASGLYEFGPFAPPTAASFTFIDSPSSIVPTVSDLPSAGMVYSAPVTSNANAFPGAYRAVPTAIPWTLTLRAKYATPMSSYAEFGIWLKDTAGKMVGEVIEVNGGIFSLIVKHCDSNTQYDSNTYVYQIPSEPNWFRLSFDGTNINLYVTWDSQNWLFFYQETSTAFLNGSLQYVGIGGLTSILNTSAWLPGSTTGALVTYWDINDDPAATRKMTK